jgi:hypothetical protein
MFNRCYHGGEDEMQGTAFLLVRFCGNAERGKKSPGCSPDSTRSDDMPVVRYEDYRGGFPPSQVIESSIHAHVNSLKSTWCNSSSNGQTRREAGTQSHGPGRSSARPLRPPGCRGVNLTVASRPASANHLEISAARSRFGDTMNRQPFRLESNSSILFNSGSITP